MHIDSLQAKLVSRWLEPERLPWKAFFDQWFLRSPVWLREHPHIPARRRLQSWSNLHDASVGAVSNIGAVGTGFWERLRDLDLSAQSAQASRRN